MYQLVLTGETTMPSHQLKLKEDVVSSLTIQPIDLASDVAIYSVYVNVYRITMRTIECISKLLTALKLFLANIICKVS